SSSFPHTPPPSLYTLSLHDALPIFELVRNQISRTAGNDLCVIAENLLLKIRVNRFYGCAVFSGKDIFCLFCSHFIALAHQNVKHCLRSDDLRRRSYKRRLAEVFPYARHFLKHIIKSVFRSLLLEL